MLTKKETDLLQHVENFQKRVLNNLLHLTCLMQFSNPFLQSLKNKIVKILNLILSRIYIGLKSILQDPCFAYIYIYNSMVIWLS
jgi:hypothetical protein